MEGHQTITLRHPSLSKRFTTFSTAKCSVDTNHHENFLLLVSFCRSICCWDINNRLRALFNRELLLKHRHWRIQWSVAIRYMIIKILLNSLTCKCVIKQKFLILFLLGHLLYCFMGSQNVLNYMFFLWFFLHWWKSKNKKYELLKTKITFRTICIMKRFKIDNKNKFFKRILSHEHAIS